MEVNLFIFNFKMKKHYLKVLVFIGVLISMDILIGIFSTIAVDKQTTGTIGLINKTVKDSSEILILGSSRTQSHYNSKIIKKITKKSVFNAGVGGQGNFLAYALLKERLEKNVPKIVVLDLAPNIMLDVKQFDKLTKFYPIATKYKTFKDIIQLKPDHKNFLMYSNAYRFNSTTFDFFYSFITPKSTDDGFVAMDGTISKLQIENELKTYKREITSKEAEMLQLQISFINDIKTLCLEKNIHFVTVISPSFMEISSNRKARKTIVDYLKKRNITLYDFSMDTAFASKNDLFRDILHLNREGSTLFSEKVGNIILKE